MQKIKAFTDIRYEKPFLIAFKDDKLKGTLVFYDDEQISKEAVLENFNDPFSIKGLSSYVNVDNFKEASELNVDLREYKKLHLNK